MSSWSGCECTFLSSETHPAVYKPFLPPCLFEAKLILCWCFSTRKPVLPSRYKCFFLLRVLVLQRGNRPISLPQIFLLFFFFHPHLFLLLLDTAVPIPPFPPLFFPSAPPTHSPSHPPTPATPLFQHLLYHPRLLSLPLFYSLSFTCTLGVCRSPGWGGGGGNLHNNVTDSTRARAACSLDFSPHVNGSCIFFMRSMHCEVFL